MRHQGLNDAPIAYDDRVLLWAKHRREAKIMDEQMAEIALEAGEELPEASTAPRATLSGDAWRLRGIPVVGVPGGLGGAIPGTRP